MGERVLARFAGPNGEIAVVEEASGARLYREGGVNQSCVLPGGEAGVAYVRLMASLLEGSASVLLLGCGGGALAGMLHRRGSCVTVVDVNPLSFELARTFFWMPAGIECIAADMSGFLRRDARTFAGIGIDVGGPDFSYEAALAPATVGGVRRALQPRGRIAVNISCETPDDAMPGRIAQRFAEARLEVWMYMESGAPGSEANAVILASNRRETAAELAAVAEAGWWLARLGG